MSSSNFSIFLYLRSIRARSRIGMGNACYSVSPFFDSLNKTWATPKMCTALFFDLMVMSFPRRNRNPNNNAFKYYDKEARRKETHTNTHEMKRNPHQVWLSSNRMSEMKIDCGKWSDCMKEDVNYQAVRINWCWQGWWKSLWFRSQLSSAVCLCFGKRWAKLSCWMRCIL